MRIPAVGMLRSIFAFIALFAVAGVHAQTNITIETANSVNKQILGVSFAPPAPPGSTTFLNTGDTTVVRIESLALGTDPTISSIDLFAADNLGHQILEYVGNFNAGNFPCPKNPSPPCTIGNPVQPGFIQYPNGLSLDNAGDLFAVNNAPGKSPSAQVWALQRNANGSFATPTRIDQPGSLGPMQAVVESMIVGTTLGTSQFTLTSAPSGSGYTGGTLMAAWPNVTGANYQITLSTGQSIAACTFTQGSTTFTCPSTNITGTPSTTINVPLLNVGDLLVVSQNPDEILLYPGPGNGNGPLQATTPRILIPTCSHPHTVGPCIPPGSTPEGVAVWPADNSILVTTFNGSILQFSTSTGSIGNATTIGAVANTYKINTGTLNGAAVGYVAQSGPGNHGSILQLIPSATGGIQLSPMSVTAGVFAPQGIAVTNTVQGATAGCVPQPPQTPPVPSGCDFFGGGLAVYNVIPDGPGNLNGNLVESLCVVPQDSRVSGNSFNHATQVVNDVCPGFDNTNVPGNPMTIPGNLRGGSGSSGSGYALIRVLTPPDQFNTTYVRIEENANAVFPGANNPDCTTGGTVVGAPEAGEGFIVEDGVNIVTGLGNLQPTMTDITDSCDYPGGGGPHLSVFAVGLELALPGVFPANLEGFVAPKYTNLVNTITELSTADNPNVNPTVASLLTNGTNGCVDVSLSLFNKAVGEGNNSGQLTQQQIYDFQDAADLLTNADTTGTMTCNSIVSNNANNPADFHETVGGAAPVYNPSGQLEGRFGNIANAITMRILNLPTGATWPTPVSVSVSPQYLFAACIPPLIGSCSPFQTPQQATLSWNLLNPPPPAQGATSCGWTTNDNVSPNPLPNPSSTNSATVGPFPITVAGTTYTYTLTCNVPAGTGPTTGVTLKAAPSGSAYTGGTLTAAWPNSTAAVWPASATYNVTLSTGQIISACTVNSTTLTCPPTPITGTPSVAISVSSPMMSVSTYLTVWPPVVMNPTTAAITSGQASTFTWTPPAGATNCSLSFNLSPPGTPPGQVSGDTGPKNGPGTYTTTYTSVAGENDTVIFQVLCGSGASFGSTLITVGTGSAIVVNTNPTSVSAGGSTTVTWTPPGGATGCTLSSNASLSGGGSFTGGTTTVNGPTAAGAQYQATYTSTETDALTNGGIVTFTATCTAGAASGSTQLTVTP